MRRYEFLEKEEMSEALENVKQAFLSAKDGREVEEIIRFLLTTDERIKIGRRVAVAAMLTNGISYDEIADTLHVGRGTIERISKRLAAYKTGFELIDFRSKKVEKEYGRKRVRRVGGSMLMKKKVVKTCFERDDVGR